MSDPIIEIIGLGKKFNVPDHQSRLAKDFWALRNVNLSIERGSKIAVLGSNGSGKSTLFKLLCEVSRPSEGSIVIRGSISSLLEIGVGFHPQLTGKENVFLSGALLGMKKNEIETRFDAIVDMAAIHGFLDLPVKRYSSGMMTRLAFAIAAHIRTEILILDEVLAVSDRKFQELAIERVKQLASEEVTIIMAGHDSHPLKEICDQAIILEKGRLIGEGTYDEMASQYEGFD